MMRYLRASYATAIGALLWHLDRPIPRLLLSRQLTTLDYHIARIAMYCYRRGAQRQR